jgi:hypothetical protein
MSTTSGMSARTLRRRNARMKAAKELEGIQQALTSAYHFIWRMKEDAGAAPILEQIEKADMAILTLSNPDMQPDT